MSGKFVADLVVDGNSYPIRVHVVRTVCVFKTGFDFEQRRFEFGGHDAVGVGFFFLFIRIFTINSR